MSEFAAEALWILVANGLVATVIALGAWIAQRCDRPRLVHALCVLALLKLITPPLWAVPVAILPAAAAHDPTLAALAPEAVVAGAADLAVAADASVSAALLAALTPATAGLALALFGTFALLTLAWVRVRRFRRLIRVADAAPNPLRARATAMALRVGLRRCPELLLLPARISPMLCMLGGRTLLLLPRDLVASIGDAELDALLTHELAHAKRRDHWVRVLELVAFALYWWLPTAWWLRRALHVAEERCCDARVLALHPARPRAYADALLHTLDFLAGADRAMPPVACGASTYTDLKKRLTTIMTRSEDRPLSRLTRTGLLALAVGVLPIAPSFAQETERADENKVRAELRSAAREVARLRAEIDAIRADLGAASKDKARHAELKDDETEAHDTLRVRLSEDIAKAVRDATKNIKVDTEALHKALASRALAGNKELGKLELLGDLGAERVKLDASHLHAQQLDPESLAKILRTHAAHGPDERANKEHLRAVMEHVAKIQAQATRSAQEALEKAHAAHAQATEAHQRTLREYLVGTTRAADDGDAAADHRKAVVERLRRVERDSDDRARAERAVAQDRKAEQADREATRARRAEDQRAAEMKAIEAEMEKLQRKLEALRKQGEGEAGRATIRRR
ncbi:MAG: hypothetical protein IPM13_17880 [Phycisphaerales bacterium]|nr:hypothetical protein [Phycisphaerales bacterium]